MGDVLVGPSLRVKRDYSRWKDIQGDGTAGAEPARQDCSWDLVQGDRKAVGNQDMPGYAMPGMGQQASPKFTQQRRSKIWFVCSLAAGSRGE